MNATLISRALAPAMALLMALLAAVPVQASVVLSGTRVIYPQHEKEVSLKLESKNQRPVLLQVWLDNGDEQSTPDLAGIPFLVTPPIFRMEPEQHQVLRLSYTGEPLPQDRESLFWFNMLEVPSQTLDAEQSNQLQLAFRTRVKLFFRPTKLPYEVEAAAAKLQWRQVSSEQGQMLEVYNPTPYHLSFDQIDLVAAEQRHAREHGASGAGNMVAPNGRNRFLLPSLKSRPSTAMTAEFETIDDFGVRVSHKTRIAP
ncbi:molecular chaperone [Pseudomonas sp. MWU13-2100]|uniref:fimbrial biogenesis chaperone n=1 Tax=Pseudomonas sp. MWU13-2100 TaxID=2935075 RepID=UPI00200E9A5F|nr:fimbria/pilus periplasmic chaperone [Pseudomonas sp. MWU13-2100]